jgi:hypothetical protein
MANENSLRSYRDFDAYNRDVNAADAVPRQREGDPLAELARIMGQDDNYTDLLKSVARTRGDARPAAEPAVEDAAHEHAHQAIEASAMPLQAEVGQDGEGVDWDDLEAELETYMRAGPEAHPGEGEAAEAGQDGLRGSYDSWQDGETTDDLERMLAEEYRQSGPRQGGHGEGSAALGYGVAAGAAAVAVGAGALAWNARSARSGPDAQASSQGAHVAAPRGEYDPAYHQDGHMAAHEEAPPRRRRAGMTAVAAVVGLAVLGGGGVLAYRTATGGAMASGEPRVIRANGEPVRVAAQATQDPKPVTDRVASGDRVLSREERPVSQREQASQVQAQPQAAPRVIPMPSPPAGVVTDPGQAPVRTVAAAPVPTGNAAAAPAQRPQVAEAAAPALRPGEEPRRVRTVQVGPDGNFMAPAQPQARPPQQAAASMPLSVVPAQPGPAQASLASAESRAVPAPQPRPVQTVRIARAETETRPAQAQAQPQTPQQAQPQRTASAAPLDLGPQRTASVRSAATASGSTFVQISSHQSEAEARSAFAAAQRRFPMLQNQTANIRSAEISGRGTWHRLRVGPYSRDEAQSVCQRLKAAGGSCVLN